MEYFYFWGLLFVLPFTIFAYIKSAKDVRIKTIISGIGFGILSIIFADDVFFTYWAPKYIIDGLYIEDFMYGFLFAGILPSMHNIFRTKKMIGKFKINFKLITLYVLILIATFCLMANILNLNYIYPLALTPLIIGIISFIKVKGKLIDVLITIACSLFITILVYNIIIFIYPNVINNHFMVDGVSNIRLLRVPLEELMFAVCLAIGCTYTYEAVFNLE